MPRRWSRVVALIVLALAPSALVALFVGGELQRARARTAGDDAARWARLAAAPAVRLVNGTQQLLIALARAPEVRAAQPAACRALFAGLIANDRRYADLGMAAPSGAILAAVAAAETVALGAPLRSHRALMRGGFAFTVAPHPPGGAPALILAHPVSDATGRLRHVLFAALRLDWLDLLAADAALPRDALLLLTDQGGRIVSRHPANVAVAEPVPVEALITGADRIVPAGGADREALRFASAPLVRTPEYALDLVVGLPPSVAPAHLDPLRTRAAIGLVLAALIALLWLWVGTDPLPARRPRALGVAGVAGVAAEEGDPRPRRSPEVERMAGAVERMAHARDARDPERWPAQALDERRRLFLACREHLERGTAIAYLLDEQGRITFANPAFAELLAATPESLRGRTPEELWSDSVARQVREHERRARVAEVPLPALETLGPGPGPAPREFLVLRFPVAGTTGITGLGAVGFEITELRDERALRDGRSREAATVEHAPDPILILDADGVVRDLNPAAERLFGQPPSASAGWGLEQLLAPAARRAEYRTWLVGCLADGDSDRAGRSIEAAARGADGREIPVELTVRRLSGAGPPSFAAYVRDRSERERARAALQQAESRLRRWERFDVAGREAVAHEFNNLLTAILGHCQLLRDHMSGDDAARRDTEQMEEAVVRAAALSRDLAALHPERTLAGRIDLSAAVAGQEEAMQRLAGAQVQVSCALGSDAGLVGIEAGELEQILACLVANARDAMPGGGTLRIRTARAGLAPGGPPSRHGVQPGRFASLAVEDSGIGMEESTCARVFEPFFSTKAAGAGAGLGLPTVRGIVDRHGGHIEVRSQLGRGTVVEICLPLVPDDDAADALAPAGNGAARSEHQVLVVEDEEIVRRVICEALRHKGYRVLEASDPATALELCRSSEIDLDLLITDVSMPGMSGPELIERLPERHAGVPVLLVSGRPDPVPLARSAGSRACAFLAKPFSPSQLLEQVQRLLRASPALAA